MTLKRGAAATLWFFTGWMLGAMAVFAVDLPMWLAPAAGTLAAVGVAMDPLGLVWRPRSPRSSANLPVEPAHLTD